MRGLKNKKLNSKIVNKMFQEILRCLLCASQQLVRDYQRESMTIENSENIIRDEIYRNYLEDNSFRKENKCFFKFEREIQENFQGKGKTPLGRVDIKVYNNDIFHNTDSYVIVECKRLDGSKRLNNEYIENGIKRFIVDPPRYSSFYGKSIMFGFLVKNNLKQETIISDINAILKNQNDIIVEQEIKKLNNFFYSEYIMVNQPKELGIYHIFYDFSSVLSKKR